MLPHQNRNGIHRRNMDGKFMCNAEQKENQQPNYVKAFHEHIIRL